MAHEKIIHWWFCCHPNFINEILIVIFIGRHQHYECLQTFLKTPFLRLSSGATIDKPDPALDKLWNMYITTIINEYK